MKFKSNKQFMQYDLWVYKCFYQLMNYPPDKWGKWEVVYSDAVDFSQTAPQSQPVGADNE